MRKDKHICLKNVIFAQNLLHDVHARNQTGAQTAQTASSLRQPPGGCGRMGVRSPCGTVRYADRLPAAGHRFRRCEDRRRRQARRAGLLHRFAAARTARRREGAARTRSAPAAATGADRLEKHPQRRLQRKRQTRRIAARRPGHQHRRAQRCGRRRAGADARQPRGLRTGTGRSRSHPPQAGAEKAPTARCRAA